MGCSEAVGALSYATAAAPPYGHEPAANGAARHLVAVPEDGAMPGVAVAGEGIWAEADLAPEAGSLAVALSGLARLEAEVLSL